MGLASGQVVAGKYRIERELGSGGMGTVYVATNVVLQKLVALKVMHHEGRPPRPEDAERFLREGVAASRVRHPGIVEVFDADAGGAGGLPWMAMELLEGESLQDRLDARRTLPVGETLAIVRGVLEALAAVHERGIVHRDLKPANVFLSTLPGGGVQPKLLDFGIAKLRDRTRLTASGSLLGTAHFMAPEQIVDSGTADARADLYAIGAMLFLCLAGEPPYQANTIFELFGKVQGEAPRDLTAIAPHVPAGIARVVRWCLAVDPTARPQSARQLAAALVAGEPPPGAFVSSIGAPTVAMAAAVASVSPLAPTLATPVATFPAPAPAPRRSSSTTCLVVAVIAVVAAPTVLGVLAAIGLVIWALSASSGLDGLNGGWVQWDSAKRPLLVDVTGDGVSDVVGWVRQIALADVTSHVAAFDGRTGAQLWITPPLGDEEFAVSALTAAAGGRLVTIDASATASAYSLADGSAAWTAALPERAVAICAGDERHVVVPLADGSATGLGLADGSRWPVPAPAPLGGEPCANRLDDALVRSHASTTAGARMLALDEGAYAVPGLRARAAWAEAGAAVAVVVGTSDQGSPIPTIAAVEAGRVLWAHDVPSVDRFRAQDDLPDAILIRGQRVVLAYAMAGDMRRVESLDLATGRVLWDVELPESTHGVSSLELDGGRVFVAHWCWLEVLDAETGARRFRIGRWQ